MSHRYLTRNILIALVMGACLGLMMPSIAPWFSWLGTLFRAALGMIVMPIIFTSILGGMGSLGDVRRLGKLGGASLAYFAFTTFLAIFVGLALVTTIQPGLIGDVASQVSQAVVVQKTMTLGEFAQSQITKAFMDPMKAMVEQQVLAIILFAVLLGAALTSMGEAGKKVFEFNHTISIAVMKIINLFMLFAPFGVFGLILDVTAKSGPGVFGNLGFYALTVVSGLGFHLFVVLPALLYFSTGIGFRQFFSAVRPAMLVAFSTSSSNCTLPVTLKCTEENLNVDSRISRFVVPLGATINMNGTALYEAVAAVFIAQLYGVSLDFTAQALIAITAALAAVGAAGIPAAGMVTMTMVLSAVGLPLEAVGLLLAIDRPLDMCRTVVNVLGDIVGSTILNKHQKKLFADAPLEEAMPVKAGA